MVAEQHPSGVRCVDAADQVEQRCLTRAVWPDQADDLAVQNRKTHIAHRCQTTEAFGDATNVEQGHGYRCHLLSASRDASSSGPTESGLGLAVARLVRTVSTML